jgi:hypothetical protein
LPIIDLPSYTAGNLASLPGQISLMKPMAFNTPDSTMYWMRHDLKGRISAFFRDRESWENIPAEWGDIRRPNSDEYQRLDHGYYESLDSEQLEPRLRATKNWLGL